MKITHTPNPLATIVELDEHEVEVLRLKLKIEQYEELIFGAHFALTSKVKGFGSVPPMALEDAVTEAKSELDPDRWCADGQSPIEKRVEELLQHYLEELRGEHVGDCTCIPMSCSKCHAEDVVGINTLHPYPGKHALHEIQSAFSRWNPETKQHDRPEVTLDAAIEKLANSKTACEYLINYRNTHFSKE